MMQKRRTRAKLLSIAVALVMALGLLPSAAFAAGTDDKGETISVYVDFEGYNLGQGYYIQPTMLTLPAGATAADAAYALLSQEGYEFKGSASFLTSVKFGWREVAVPTYILEDELWQTVYDGELDEAAEEGWIGSYDYSLMAGWMYTVNHAMGDALSEQLLADGDVVRCQFSLWGYGLDLGVESDWGTGTPYYAHADKTGLIRAMFVEGAGEAAKKSALDVVINPLSTPAQVASALAALQNGGAKRPATLASLSAETINQPLINGYPGGTLWKAGAAPDTLGTRGFATAAKDYRVFYLPEITATSLSCAPTIATSWLRVSVDGDTLFTGHALNGLQVSLTQAQTMVEIDVCTAETFEENGGFVVEDTYTASIQRLPVTQAEIDDIKIKTLSVAGGELLTPFEPDAAGMSIYVKAENGAAVTYTFTTAEGTTAYKHITSSTAANTLTQVDGAYSHTETASQPFLPSILLGYQTAIATAKNVTVDGLSMPVRYQYKFLYNVGGAIEGGPDEVVDYICPASQYTNNPAYGMNPERLLYGGIISLGNFGGYITVRYDTPIKNSPNNKYGVDFKINGNSNGGQGFSEPGNVWVSKDGEQWYLLAGSDYFDDNTIRDYEVTYVRNPDGTASYRDNQGSKIAINPPALYKYPLPANYPLHSWKPGEENEIAFKGPLLTSSAADPYGSSMAAFPEWGYVDARDGDGTRNTVNPYTAASGAGSSYDISWAVDGQGNPVYLDEISYIRVSTASHIYAGAIGEKSTEVSLIVSAEGAASPVGATAAPASIAVNGESVPIAEGQFTYEAAFGDSAVSVSVEGAEGKTVYINNMRGAARTYESPPSSGIIRVIVQEGDKEPLVYYIYDKAGQTEPPGLPESVKVTVAVADNEGCRFIMLPTEITVSEGKAAEYGYANAAPGHLVGGLDHGVYPGQVTALDALISAHEMKYGEGFDPAMYLSGTSTSASLTKMFGIGPYITFTVNNRALVGTMSDGYAINEYTLHDGDAVVFVRGTEDSWGMDYYSYFGASCMNVEADEVFELTLLGFDPMGQMAGLPGTPTPPLNVAPIPDAFIMLVNPDGTLDLLDETEGYSTDAQGKVQLSIREPGAYFISAVGMIENDWGMDVSTGLPFCEVTVTESGPAVPPAAYEEALACALGWIRSNVASPEVDSVGGEWAVLALARAGVNDGEWYGKYLAALDASLADGSEVASWTDFERVALALTALGIDAADYNGHDLTEPFKAYKPNAERPASSRALNSDIFALIALNSKPYSGDAGQFLGAVLNAEKAGGGWGLAAAAEVDVTAMAVQALAPYCGSDEAVQGAVSRVLAWLNSQVVSDVEGIAQIVVALAALGIDAADFDGKDYVDELLAYYDGESGGFLRNGAVNMMATEQAAYALVAYDRFASGKNSLYDMSDAGGGTIVVPINKSALDAAISSVPGSKGNYTDASWNSMQSALAAARIARDDPDATQAQVDSATAALLAAIAALTSGTGTPPHQSMTVTFSLYGAPKHNGAPVYIWKTNSRNFQGWIVNERYTFEASQATVFEVFERALADHGFSASYTSRNNYVESISGPNGPIGEFDNGENSGWMYMVNGAHVKTGLSDQTVKNGDTILWHYTDDYTQEEGAPYWKPPVGPGSPGGTGGGGAREEPDAVVIGESETPLSELAGAFTDVKESDWFYGAVAYAVGKGLMNGTSATLFSPNMNLTRAMLVTILYRNEGEPEHKPENPFSDVASGQWYTDAVIWAYENGIASGYGNGLFGTNDHITREQLVTMLHNYAKWKELDVSNSADLAEYADVGAVSAWAFEAMAWAVAEGVVTGRTETTLVPKGAATRAEAATMLMRYLGY